MNGGNGIDTADYSATAFGVAIHLANNTATGSGVADGDTFFDIENIRGGSGNDTLTGNSGDNVIWGGAGDDFLRGNGGVDQLFGEAGNDSFTLNVFLQTTNFSIDGGADQDTVNVTGNGTLTLSQLSFITNVETIDFEAANAIGDLANFTATHAVNVLGTSGPGNTLTIKMDGNDTFSVAAGEHFTQTGSDYTFFTDGTLTTELAKVSIV
jgi:Ca2+-binding RTX toxin-like protein